MMEISEAQIAKGNLERQIAMLIMKYETETDTRVIDIYINREDYTVAGGKIAADFEIKIRVVI